MKGIRKLFFGLILMTLFGVGFKVDVKAASYIKKPKLTSVWVDQNDDKWAEFTVAFSVKDENGFFNMGIINVELVDEDDTRIESEAVEYKIDGETKVVKYNDAEHEYAKTVDDLKINVPISDVYDLLDENGEAKVKATWDYDDIEESEEYPIPAYRINPSVKTSNGKDLTSDLDFSYTEGGTSRTVGTTTSYYLLNGDTAKVSIVDDDNILKGLKLKDKDGWTVNEKLVTLEDYDELYAEVTTKANNTKVIDVTATFETDPDSLIIYDDNPNESAFPRSVASGFWSKTLNYNFVDGEDISNQIETVEVGGTPLLKSQYQVTADTFRFYSGGVISKNNSDFKKLKIKLKNNTEYEFDVIIADMSKMNFYPGTDDKIYVIDGKSTSVKPSYTYGTVVGYDNVVVASGNYYTFSDDIPDSDKFEITGTKETGLNGKNLSYTPRYDIDAYEKSTGAYTEKKTVIKTYTPKVVVLESGSDIDLYDTIYVNKKLSIGLSKFTDSDSSDAAIVTNNAKGYITVSLKKSSSGSSSGNTVTGLIEDIIITGTNQTGSRTGITAQPGGDTAKVVVFPEPSITYSPSGDSKSVSGSSSALANPTYTFSITMPEGDFHDDYKVQDLKTTEIVAINSSGEEKVLGTKSLSSGTSTKTASFSVTAKALADAFGKNEDTVTIRAYAYPNNSRDSKIYAETTLKYNYGNNSTTPTPTPTPSNRSGEGMDGLDDVPTTGESKTDIWILWSVLFVSILGAGFMIWKRFGLVRAIAEADEEVAVAEHKEEVKARKKEKEDKIKMLKDLRNL